MAKEKRIIVNGLADSEFTEKQLQKQKEKKEKELQKKILEMDGKKEMEKQKEKTKAEKEKQKQEKKMEKEKTKAEKTLQKKLEKLEMEKQKQKEKQEKQEKEKEKIIAKNELDIHRKKTFGITLYDEQSKASELEKKQLANYSKVIALEKIINRNLRREKAKVYNAIMPYNYDIDMGFYELDKNNKLTDRIASGEPISKEVLEKGMQKAMLLSYAKEVGNPNTLYIDKSKDEFIFDQFGNIIGNINPLEFAEMKVKLAISKRKTKALEKEFAEYQTQYNKNKAQKHNSKNIEMQKHIEKKYCY